MTIAFDVSYIQTRRAGLGRYATELLRALLATDTENLYKLHGWSYSIDRDWIANLPQRNVQTYVTKIPGFVKRFYWNRLRVPPIEAFIGRFDLFQSIDPFLPPTRNKKTVTTIHDLSYRKFPELFEPNVLRWDPYVLRSVRRASAIIVPSDQTKNDITELFRVPQEKITLVRPPVSQIFSPEPNRSVDEAVMQKHQLGKPFILFVGTIEPRKDVDSLIKAFEILRLERQSDVQLLIVGRRGWLYDKTFEAMRSSTVRDEIHYTDFVPDSELASLYRLSQFVVYPSFYEGHGSPVVEAMASGKARLSRLLR